MKDMPDNSGHEPDDNDTPELSGRAMAIIAAVLVLIAWFLAVQLRHFGSIQDCVMQGRTNCVEVQTGR